MYEVYTGLLKMMETFQKSEAECNIVYETDADYSELKSKYALEQVAGEGTDEERSFRVLSWLSDHVKHKGNYDGHIPDEAMKLLDYAFDKETGINCRSLSITLTECLLALGLKTRVVSMHPLSPYDCDNHVVCEVWSKERGKWILLDATYGSGVFYDGVPLHAGEIRKLLADRKKIVFSETMNYNGEFVDCQEVREYYAKDMFWFRVSEVQGCHAGAAGEERWINFAPVGFDAEKFMRTNLAFREELWGKQEWLAQQKKKLDRTGAFRYQDLEELYKEK